MIYFNGSYHVQDVTVAWMQQTLHRQLPCPIAIPPATSLMTIDLHALLENSVINTKITSQDQRGPFLEQGYENHKT